MFYQKVRGTVRLPTCGGQAPRSTLMLLHAGVFVPVTVTEA
jgi:hypothetical protein